jgi:hypothetical protein
MSYYSQFQAKKLTEYYEAPAEQNRLPLQRLQISHPDEFPPMKRMVSVHELDVKFNEEDQFSTVSSGRSQGTPSKRPSKPLPKPPVDRQVEPPPNVMSPLTLPQQLSPIMRQSKPVYNSIFGYNQADNTETYTNVINSNYETPAQLEQPPASKRPASVKSHRRSINTDPVPNPQYFLSPNKNDYLDCSDDEAASLYSYHSVVSHQRSIASKRSMELGTEMPNTDQPPKADAASCMYDEGEEDSEEYKLPELGIMGGGWNLHINNPSREGDYQSTASQTPPSEPPISPHDYSSPMHTSGSKEQAGTLFMDPLTEAPLSSVSPFWQQVSPMTRSPSQLDYFLQPTVFLDPTRVGATSPVSSIGTSSFTGSYRQYSGSDFSYDTRPNSPGLNLHNPFVQTVNEVAAQDYRNSWAGPSPEWIQSMNAAKQRSSVPPPPVAAAIGESAEDNTKSRYSIASHSLTNDPDTIKTMRRMANLTKDHKTQTVYALYLLEVCQMHEKVGGSDRPVSATRQRLLQEAIYWIERLSKERHGEATYIKGLWHQKGLHGYKKSEDKAYRMWQRAAKSDHVKAKFKLAQYHESKGNKGKAVAYYKSATAKGGVEPNFVGVG